MRYVRWLSIALLMALTLSCTFGAPRVKVGEKRTVTQTVPLSENITKARVRVQMNVGDLTLHGGAQDLIEGAFTFNVAELEPQIDVSVVSNQAHVVVRQPELRRFTFDGRVVNDWALSLNNRVPVELNLALGVANANVDLSDIPVERLEVQAGTGELDLVVKGNETMTTALIRAGVGDITLDLRGDWKTNLDLMIEGGVGQITLYVPSVTGVRVKVEQGAGNVEVQGLRSEHGDYVNEAYGESPITMTITIQTGVGRVRIIG